MRSVAIHMYCIYHGGLPFAFSLTENVNQTGLGYGKLLHGEAVAIGMHMAADMSCRMGWVDQELVDRSVALMQKAGLPVELPKGGGMDMDKFLTVSVDIGVLY